MAVYSFKLPDIGEGIAEAEIVAWHVKVGDTVAEDQSLADMMTDKATVEMESPVAGVVIELAGEPGDTIAIGSTLVVIETEAETESDTVVAENPGVEVAADSVKLKRSLEIASKIGARRVLIIGDQELAEGRYQLKDMSRGEQRAVSEDELLAQIFPLLPRGGPVVVAPGDDTALVRTAYGSVLATTDTMVRGRDWLDEWSSPADVGGKSVAQNVADIASMGGLPRWAVVGLSVPPDLEVDWVLGFYDGLVALARETGTRLVGGDTTGSTGPITLSVTVVGEASSAGEVLNLARESQTDLLLLDISMPGVDGLDLIKQINEQRPELPVLVLSMHNEGQIVQRALKSGADEDVILSLLVAGIARGDAA